MFTARNDHQACLAPMNSGMFILLVLILLSSTISALAQNGIQFRNWKPSLNDGAAVKPKRDCGALVGLTGSEFSIKTATPVPLDKLKIIADRVYAKCDGADGLVDGLIDDPRQCNFDPAKELPICANDVDGKDCFTSAQIRTLNVIYRGAESGGKRIFFGQPLGAEIEAPSQGGAASIWANWIIARAGRTISYNFAETFFRYLAFPKPDPNYDLKSFNLETDLPKLQAISGVLDAKNTDLTRFKARGGKIV